MAQTDFVSRGQELVLAGQYQEAVKICRLGLLARPTEIAGRLVLAQALLALRRYDEVLAEMRVAIELDSRNAGAHQLKGEALLRKGDAFAAVETLERASALAPADPAIAGLLAEGRLAIAADGARSTGPSLGDYGDSLTKHYPAHRGGDVAGTGASGSLTRPVTTGRRAGAKGERMRTPSPAELAVGDRSGTVELDPELEGIAAEEEDDDAVAEPPMAASTGTSTMAVGDDELIEVDEVEEVDFEPQATAAQRPAVRGPRANASASAPAPLAQWGADESSTAETNAKNRLPVPAPPVTGEQPTVRRAPTAGDKPTARRAPTAGDQPTVPRPLASGDQPTVPRPLASGDQPTVPRPLASLRPRAEPAPVAPPPRPQDPIDALFPDDDGGAGRGSPARLGDVPAGPLDDVAPSRAPAGLPVTPPGTAPAPAGSPLVPKFAPQAKTMVPATPASIRQTVIMQAEIPAPPPPAPPAPPPPAPSPVFDPGPGRAQLAAAPLDGTGVVVAPPGAVRPLVEGGRAETALVRPGSATLPPPGRTRRPWLYAVWALVTVVIIGGGVLAGFWIRDLRLDKQIGSARRGATTAARADTWQGWRGARDRLVGINRARASSGHRAALARARAVLAADYHDDLDGARAAVNELGELGGKDAALARAWLAIAEGDAAAARTAAAAAGAGDDPDVSLVMARAGLVEARWDDAAAAARATVERDPRPAARLALCEAEAARKLWSAAEKACGELLTAAPGHPGAIIARARIAAGSGAARRDPPRLVAELEALVTEAARAATESLPGVSPGQAAWAQLALAEVHLAVGDAIAARRALERAQGARVDARGFIEAEAAVLLALGDIGAARAAAERGLARWATSAPLMIVLARARLAAGDVAAASAALSGLSGASTTTADALVARAELARGQGDLDAAQRDLDAALAKSPDFEQALVARAELDLDRGDPAAALVRIEPRFGPQAAAPVAIVFAGAKRATRQFDAARDALTRFKDGPASPLVGRVWLELARIERDAGELTPARAAYGKAAEMLPASRAVRLESAVLLVDDGDAAGGRDALVRLAGDAPDDGMVQVEVARAHLLTGDLAAAATALEAAERAGASKARVARERGRLALRRRDVAVAVSGLDAAAKAMPDDLEARLLLMDAYLLGGNITGAQQLADELTRTFPGRPETHLARGRLELFGDRPGEAQKQFTKARDLLVKAPRRQRADANFWLAQSVYAAGDVARAKAILLEATSTDAFHADAWSVLATVLSELSDFGGAAQAAEKAIKLDPDNTDAYFVLGEALALSRRIKESKKPLQEYLKRAGPEGARVEDARTLLKKR